MQMFLRRITNFKDIVNSIRKNNNSKIYSDAANINLTTITVNGVEEAKVRLKDFQSRIQEIKNKQNQELGSLEAEKRSLIGQINEISVALKGLSQNKVNFPPQLIQLRQEIQEGLKRIFAISRYY